MVGQTISHYRIISELGRGGMGIVYKAEDTKLDRTVALKLLPQQALANPDDKARFYREARAAAALHHPNIATVFEIDEVDGQAFIAMEFIDGMSIEAKVAKELFSIQDIVSIGTAIARGLKVAHDRGIVHRDVKSANIMLAPDGQPKILDFGLAKTAASTKLTRMGSTMGTAAYMSPEQTRGGEVDRRTDIWSLGVVLYEMVTGKLPFQGDYEQAVVYSILNDEPKPPTSIRTGVPMQLEQVIQKLLAKDPDARYQHCDDVIVDLQAVAKPPVVEPQTAPVNTVPKPRYWVGVAVGAVSMAAVALIAGFLTGVFTSGDGEGSNSDVVHIPVGLGTTDGGTFHYKRRYDYPSFALTPNGKKLVYVGGQGDSRMLWVQDFEFSAAPTALEGTEGARYPIVSPDGRHIAFIIGNTIRRVGLDGAAAETIMEGIGSLAGMTWTANDEILYAPNFYSPIWSVPVFSTGTPKQITDQDRDNGEIGQSFPTLLPGGKTLLITSYGTSIRIVAIALDTGRRTVLFDGGYHASYVSSGYLAVVQGKSLFAVAFDASTLQVGQPRQILDDLVSLTGSMAGQYALSARGDLVYLGGDSWYDSALIQVHWDRSTHLITDGRKGINWATVAPGGRIFGLHILPSAGAGDIWQYDRAADDYQQLTFGKAWDGWPRFSPDGQLVFASERLGATDLFIKDSIDAEPRPFVVSEYEKYPGPISSSSRYLPYTEDRPDTSQDIFIAPMDAPEEAYLWLGTRFDEFDPAISPDERWIAYTSNESGREEVYVRTFDGARNRRKISRNGGSWPHWGPDGKHLYYSLSASQTIEVVDVLGEGKDFSQPRVAMTGISERWDVLPDGSGIIALEMPDPPQVRLVLNWAESLRER